MKAVTAAAGPHPLPQLTLTRGSRRLAFTLGGRALVYLRGEIPTRISGSSTSKPAPSAR